MNGSAGQLPSIAKKSCHAFVPPMVAKATPPTIERKPAISQGRPSCPRLAPMAKAMAAARNWAAMKPG